jgi:hypothetical protein
MAKRGARRRVSKPKRTGVVKARPLLRAYAFGHALGLMSVVALLFYTIMVWFSDFNASIIIQQFPIKFSFFDWTIILGLIQTYVLSYIAGWIFVKIYNKT